MTYQSVATTYLERATRELTVERSLWERILGLVEQDLAQHRDQKLVVEVQEGGESGSSYYEKEIGELSASERRSLPLVLKEHVAERLLERYLAERGHVDLLERRRAYTKKIEDLSPEDLPALIKADRQRAYEEEHRTGRERAGFAREARAGSGRMHVVLEPAEQEKMSRAMKEVHR